MQCYNIFLHIVNGTYNLKKYVFVIKLGNNIVIQKLIKSNKLIGVRLVIKNVRGNRKYYHSFTDILYTRPSYIKGAMRILDLGQTVNDYNYSETFNHADYKALSADWLTVGNDLRNVCCNVRK